MSERRILKEEKSEYYWKNINSEVFNILNWCDDNLERKREITHWFYFEDFNDLERFEKYAEEIGFKTDFKTTTKEDNKDFLLIIFKTDEINKDHIDFDSFDFSKKAEEFNGKYDGWETSIELG